MGMHSWANRGGRLLGVIAALALAIAPATSPVLAQGIQRPTPPVVVHGPGPDLDGVYRVRGTNPDATPYTGIAAVSGDGTDYGVTWWIDDVATNGDGKFDGPILAIDFGDTTPVRYSTFANGQIDGTWADGKGTETLTLYARADRVPGTIPVGRYAVAGHRVDGAAYTGTAAIYRDGQAGFEMTWEIAGQAHSGRGQFAGGVLAIQGDDPGPVVYAMGIDGVLRGLWAGGKADETLTPVPR